MKTKLFFTLLLTSMFSFGQTLPIYEGFNYLDGSLLIDHTSQTGQGPWVAQSWTNSTNNPFIIASPFADYSGLPSITGNALRIVGSGNDPILYYNQVTESSGTNVYASCMFYLADMLTAAGSDYVMALTTPGFGYGAALYFSRIGTTNTYNLGINESNTSAEAQIYTGATYTAGVDKLFIVIKYEFKATGNSVAHLYINPTINGAIEPTSTFDSSALTLGDEANKTEFSILKLNINGNSRTPDMAIDEIRVGTTWASVVGVTLGVSENELAELKIYPNPAKDYITIESKNEKISSVDIYSVLGKQVLSQKALNDNRMNISSLTKGVYFVQINGENSGKITKKIVVD